MFAKSDSPVLSRSGMGLGGKHCWCEVLLVAWAAVGRPGVCVPAGVSVLWDFGEVPLMQDRVPATLISGALRWRPPGDLAVNGGAWAESWSSVELSAAAARGACSWGLESRLPLLGVSAWSPLASFGFGVLVLLSPVVFGTAFSSCSSC